MLEINEQYLLNEATAELRKLLPQSSFASVMCRQLGAAFHERLFAWGEESEGSRGNPMLHLYLWLSGGWSLDPEWLLGTDKIWRDDSRRILPSKLDRSYTKTEQLAAYGIYIAEEELPSLGPLVEAGLNSQGWSREQVLIHRSNCLTLTFQALAFALKLRNGGDRTVEEISQAARAAAARMAADARHAKPGGTRSKRDHIRALWLSGNYSSRDICAEQECAALDMSFSTARKALRNTPVPPSRSE